MIKIAPVFNLVLRFNSVAGMSRHLAKKSKCLREDRTWTTTSYISLHVLEHSAYAAVFLLCSSPLGATKLEKQTQDVSGWPAGTE